MDRDFKEILIAELVAVTGGVFAGSMLAFFTGKLEMIPAMFVLLPGFLEMKGGVGGSLSARISSSLHKGTLKTKNISKKFLFGEGFVSFSLLVCTSLILGFITFVFSWLVLNIFLPLVIFVPVIAILLSSLFELSLFVFSVVFLYSRGFDPDNVMGPYVTTIGDITSILSLVIAVVLLL
ncbi:MAG: hypothetical protein GON13_03300 [Nanoarchaeota archaeon]|nr:hypothetical protein [Nanoarchaeota archaeon]